MLLRRKLEQFPGRAARHLQQLTGESPAPFSQMLRLIRQALLASVSDEKSITLQDVKNRCVHCSLWHANSASWGETDSSSRRGADMSRMRWKHRGHSRGGSVDRSLCCILTLHNRDQLSCCQNDQRKSPQSFVKWLTFDSRQQHSIPHSAHHSHANASRRTPRSDLYTQMEYILLRVR